MRPTRLYVGGTLYWTIQTRNPDTLVLKDADSTPTVSVRKNGTAVGDSVTVTKRTATTGLYDCSYNPAGEAANDSFQFEELATVTGTTTASAIYPNQFAVFVQGASELDSASVTAVQSGLALEATSQTIKAQTDLIGSAAGATTLLAAAVLEPGTITSFPETLTIGDSYTEQNGREIQIPIVDTDGTPLSSTGSLNFADASITFTLQRSGETDSTRVITGSATFVDPPGTGTGAGAPYAVIELPASETAKGLKKYKYSGILTFTWTYAGTGTADDVMSFETDTVTFDN